MKRTNAARAELPDEAAAESAKRPDGRRLRSGRSREQIVHAMIKLIRAGDMAPGAASVADAAGVSLRTVFRHFEEMDTLYREMTAIIEAEVLPLVEQPFCARGWRNRLDELISRRALIYERIMPLKVAGSLRRFQSSYLRTDYDRFVRMERQGLHAVLPERVLADANLVSAIEMATAFQAWRRLRQDQGLSAARAEAVMRLAVGKLVDGA